MATTSAPHLEFAGIWFEQNRILEIDSDRVMHLVPREEIDEISLRFGYTSRHPILQAVFGAALACLAVPPLLHFVDWIQHGGVLFTMEAGLLVVAVIGAALLVDAPRRAYLLEIRGKQNRWLAFARKSDANEVQNFVRAAASQFGYVINFDSAGALQT